MTARQSTHHFRYTQIHCRSWLASDGGLIANLDFVDRVHIHSCGNDHLGFRFYSESLGKTERRPTLSNQGLLPLTFGASPRLCMPSLRSCSVGPPRWAILGPARLNRHPCRFTHYAEPERSLSTGQEKSKARSQSKARRPTGRPDRKPYAYSPQEPGLPANAYSQPMAALQVKHEKAHRPGALFSLITKPKITTRGPAPTHKLKKCKPLPIIRAVRCGRVF
jgi:hypothetical protein